MNVYLRIANCGLIVALCVGGLLAALAGCGASDPFERVKVSGKVTYDDGSLIPGERVVVTFLPQAAPLDAKTYPRPGVAEVKTVDGTFSAATTKDRDDGIVAGRHKVLVQSLNSLGTPTDAVPSEYGDSGRTPLEIDAAQTPLKITVRKPL
jgi:hypothetical protein